MIIDFIKDLNHVQQALLATLFTWFVTALGSVIVFFFKNINKKLMDGMMGFAAGVMIAASFWSLLAPSIKMSEQGPLPSWIPPAIGFLAGGGFLYAVNKFLPHLHIGHEKAEGMESGLHRSILLVLAVTLHNIPEGLAVGVAFGAIGAGLESASLAGAIALAIGIGLQNFPEGAAVSMPLRREGLSRTRSFLYGQASGIVEPIAGVLGALLVVQIQSILPYALAFAAGSMIFVVVEELIPESQLDKNADLATLCTLFGFTIMMILDVALG